MVLEILESLEFEHISKSNSRHGPTLRFCRPGGDNPSAMEFFLDTLKFRCYTTGERGDIYSLVMKQRECDFPDALRYVAKKAGVNVAAVGKPTKTPFGGFYKKIAREEKEPEYTMKTYSDSILAPYLGKHNLMFFKDGIDFQTQEFFRVGYDLESLRITVPNWTLDGKVCGIMGRCNDPECSHDERWLPVIPCSRTYTLYGFHQNYDFIQSKGTVVIGESEKFVQQMHSMGSRVGLATCGSDVSGVQARHIKSLLVPKVILAYDEGLEEDKVRGEAEKLIVDNQVFKNRVGYVWDPEHDVLPLGSKASPTDLGIDKFVYLISKKVKWLQ